MMESAKILTRQEGKILRITLNRPEKKNALNYEMYAELSKALTMAEDDQQIVAIVLDGQGDSFTAGNDIKDFLVTAEITEQNPAAIFLKKLAAFPKIILAAVQGAAVGIGTTLLLHCDLIIAADNAQFQLPFVNLGLVPEAASSLLLPARLGYNKAAELLLLGDMFNAETALKLGLVNQIVTADELDTAITTLANRIQAKNGFALLESKRLLKLNSQTSIEERMKAEFQSFEICLSRPEFKMMAEKFLMAKKAPS